MKYEITYDTDDIFQYEKYIPEYCGQEFEMEVEITEEIIEEFLYNETPLDEKGAKWVVEKLFDKDVFNVISYIEGISSEDYYKKLKDWLYDYFIEDAEKFYFKEFC